MWMQTPTVYSGDMAVIEIQGEAHEGADWSRTARRRMEVGCVHADSTRVHGRHGGNRETERWMKATGNKRGREDGRVDADTETLYCRHGGKLQGEEDTKRRNGVSGGGRGRMVVRRRLQQSTQGDMAVSNKKRTGEEGS